jgi:hypothetical protein
MVMGLTGGLSAAKNAEDTFLDNYPVSESTASPPPTMERKVEKAPAKEVDFDNDDESLSYFAKLAED